MRLIDAWTLYAEVLYDWGTMDSEKFEKAVFEKIANASTVDCWIPCSERLPEEDGEYLIWCVSYDVTTGDKAINTYGISYYDTQFEAWTGVHVGGFLWNEVTAWMPLPKPYKEETDEF